MRASASAAASTAAASASAVDGDVAAQLAVDLHRVLDGVRRRAAPGRPSGTVEGDRRRRAPAAATAPRRRGGRTAPASAPAARRPRAACGRSLVRWLLSSISLAIAVLKRSTLELGAHDVDRAMQAAPGLVVGRLVGDTASSPGLLVDEVAPHPLQEAVHARPRPAAPTAARRRAVRSPSGAAGTCRRRSVAHLVGGDEVLQALAHLPPLAVDGPALVA